MEKIVGRFFMKNGKFADAADFSFTLNPQNVYEVIRVIDGIPLFLEDHLARMTSSLALQGMRLTETLEKIRNLLLLLIKKNNVENGNIKLLINGAAPDIYLYFIPHAYPAETLYEAGVDTATLAIVRHNPNAKVIDARYKAAVTAFIEEKNIYEALLVNPEGCITEGSKSNLFFVRGEKVLTPPLKDVLGGVTRQRILDLCKENGIPVEEVPVPLTDLPTWDGAFISGTSPKVLPIRSIDGRTLSSTDNPVIQKIRRCYEDKIQHYQDEHR